MEFGLIGKKLSHSFSPNYFNEKFNLLSIKANYSAFEIDNAGEILNLLKLHPQLKGLNVTIPFKQEIIPFLDIIHPIAKEIGAVNTIKITNINGKYLLEGFNTDYYGFSKALASYDFGFKKALVLGSGGASKAIIYTLKLWGIEYEVVSSSGNGNLNYNQLNENNFSKFDLIINTTPLGMYPNVETFPPIPYQLAHENQLFFDTIYNPEKTQFMKKAIENGAMAVNGLKMLICQAEESWEIWNA